MDKFLNMVIVIRDFIDSLELNYNTDTIMIILLISL